jgi:L-seryl-tRNA(Ser) seleniumtransferase
MRPPSVDTLARKLAADPRYARLGHASLVACARRAVHEEPEDAEAHAHLLARRLARSLMTPVINATGVLLHTNLGRAPLLAAPESEAAAAEPSSSRYSNLEFDLDSGTRGSRRSLLESLLTFLTGAEAALVVNNCAAAVMLALAAHATGRGVVVSRGELVEIGGGFRIPDVLQASGAHLVEVGTTNRTRLHDYATAIAAGAVPVAATLKVHQSNYRMVGFTEETSLPELVGLGVPVIADIGSGLLDSNLPWLASRSGQVPPLPWLSGEPGARQTVDQGAQLVIFSGDKLLGGPQAGILVGQQSFVDACARHPLARALRPGATVVAALQNTLLAYGRNEARSIPFWRMATVPVDDLRVRANRAVELIGDLRVTAAPMDSVPGGGTLPDRVIPSFGLSVRGQWAEPLRAGDLPVIARTGDGATLLDLRTVDPNDDQIIVRAILGVLSNG